MSQALSASNFEVDVWTKELARKGSASGLFPAKFLAYSSTPKLEAACFSETSVNFYRSLQRPMPEENTLQGEVSKNVTS
jgi:hypothetical protein